MKPFSRSGQFSGAEVLAIGGVGAVLEDTMVGVPPVIAGAPGQGG